MIYLDLNDDVWADDLLFEGDTKYHNQEGGDTPKPTTSGRQMSNIDVGSLAESATTVVDSIAAISASRQPKTEDEANIRSICGKSPGFLSGKRKKESYKKCAEDYYKKKYASLKEQGKIRLAELEAEKIRNNSTKSTKKSNVGLYIGIGVGAVLILGAVLFLTLRKNKSISPNKI